MIRWIVIGAMGYFLIADYGRRSEQESKYSHLDSLSNAQAGLIETKNHEILALQMQVWDYKHPYWHRHRRVL